MQNFISSSIIILLVRSPLDSNTTIFIANSAADYGGAVYIDDDTNSGKCASDTKSESVLAIHGVVYQDIKSRAYNYFSLNFADISGSTLYMEDC